MDRSRDFMPKRIIPRSPIRMVTHFKPQMDYMGMVQNRMKNKNETSDIFFTENRTDTQCVSKIDSWRNSKPVYSSVENWAYDEIYPAQAKTYGTIELTVPCKPRAVLMTQYGQKCMQECVSRSFLFSHNTPFSLFDFFWRKKNK